MIPSEDARNESRIYPTIEKSCKAGETPGESALAQPGREGPGWQAFRFASDLRFGFLGFLGFLGFFLLSDDIFMGTCLSAIILAESNALSFTLGQTPLAALVISALLLLLSTLSWAIMGTKFSLLRRAANRNEAFLKQFRDSESPLELFESETEIPGAPLYAVYRAATRELTFSALGSAELPRGVPPPRSGRLSIASSQMRGIRSAMERAVGEATLRIETRLPLLAAIVSAGPFLGLLGTVWGVIVAFADTAMAGQEASLQSMSPGIAASLLTTLIGLLVAVPAVFGYNYLMARIRRMVVQLDNFASELATAFDRLYVDHLGTMGASRPSLLAMGEAIVQRHANMRRSDLGGSAARELREPTEDL